MDGGLVSIGGGLVSIGGGLISTDGALGLTLDIGIWGLIDCAIWWTGVNCGLILVFDIGIWGRIWDWWTLVIDTGLNGIFDCEKMGYGENIVGRLFAKDNIAVLAGLTDWTISTAGIWLIGFSLKDTTEAD